MRWNYDESDGRSDWRLEEMIFYCETIQWHRLPFKIAA